jgi:uncharacterized protein
MHNNYLPATANPRILSVDVLRGLALFGILAAHMIFWYSGGPLPERFYQSYMDVLSGISIGVYMLFINSKFFAIFSFLFGLSFYIQINSLSKHNQSPTLRFAWRLLLLGIIGIIHHAIWRADILSIYVPLGFVLLLMRNLSDKTLLIIGAACVLNLPTKIIEGISIVLQGTPQFIPNNFIAEGKRYFATMTTHSISQMVIDNLYYMKEKYEYQLSSGRLFITLGFFLLGMLAGRRRWFADTEIHLDNFKSLWKKAGKTFLITAGAGIAFGVSLQLSGAKMEEHPWLRWCGGSIVDLLNASLTVFYICWLPLLMQKAKWHNRLAALAPVGKMALTSYLMQTLFGVTLFFGVGFGLLLDTSPALNLLLAVMIFAAQIQFCRFWLTYFHYGPVEWLWRSATYLKWQPMRKYANHMNALAQTE